MSNCKKYIIDLIRGMEHRGELSHFTFCLCYLDFLQQNYIHMLPLSNENSKKIKQRNIRHLLKLKPISRHLTYFYT